ncbi:MAG: hypothetical protein ACLFMZ_02545 [Spirochaetaceae bacterium]
MARISRNDQKIRGGMCIFGLFLLSVSLYQNIVLELPYFYALFSVGKFLLLLSLYNTFAAEALFENWNLKSVLLFGFALLAVCIVIDRTGMFLGYWEYPHYTESDQLRKYIFEWAIALLYHQVSLLLGYELFKRLKLGNTLSFLLAVIVVVTPVGFITEALNLKVYSWRVLNMPFTNFRIGDYFLVFQTIGYWTMAIIPYALYIVFDTTVKKNSSSIEQPLPS